MFEPDGASVSGRENSRNFVGTEDNLEYDLGDDELVARSEDEDENREIDEVDSVSAATEPAPAHEARSTSSHDGPSNNNEVDIGNVNAVPEKLLLNSRDYRTLPRNNSAPSRKKPERSPLVIRSFSSELGLIFP